MKITYPWTGRTRCVKLWSCQLVSVQAEQVEHVALPVVLSAGQCPGWTGRTRCRRRQTGAAGSAHSPGSPSHHLEQQKIFLRLHLGHKLINKIGQQNPVVYFKIWTFCSWHCTCTYQRWLRRRGGNICVCLSLFVLL